MNPAFEINELITWLQVVKMRWGSGRVTGRLAGSGINLYQDGTLRGAIDLDCEHPYINYWADDDA
jgi:hypothetical protein